MAWYPAGEPIAVPALDETGLPYALGSAQLTAREVEVLKILTEGVGAAEIARRLFIAQGTVRTHILNILMKLQVHSSFEAKAFAIRHGLVPRLPPGSKPAA